MKQGRFSNEQIVRILREADQDSVAEVHAVPVHSPCATASIAVEPAADQ